MQTMMDVGVFTKGISNLSTINHAPAYDDMVKYGYRYYIDQCLQKLAGIEDMDIDRMEQKITWESLIITMEAIIAFAHRYADLADQMAAETSDPGRRE